MANDIAHLVSTYTEEEAMGLLSKKLESFRAAVALHFGNYNFVRMHRSLRMTPTMAGGTNHVWIVPDLVAAK